MGVGRATFYDSRLIAIVPMGFCFPGSGRAGDLPPRPECAAAWRAPLLAQLRRIEFTLVIGRYALDYHLRDERQSLTDSVAAWRRLWPAVLPLPHPSPRNQAWLKRNPWFETDVLPALRARVSQLCSDTARE